MKDSKGFYTLKGYQLNEANQLTVSMEDYLEMICRILEDSNVVRINEIAEKLHVRPSSASKMVQNLKIGGYIDFQKYGYVNLTKKGLEVGKYLLYRHEVLHNFLCILNHSENELNQVEKIEHFLNRSTIENIEKLTEKMDKL